MCTVYANSHGIRACAAPRAAIFHRASRCLSLAIDSRVDKQISKWASKRCRWDAQLSRRLVVTLEESSCQQAFVYLRIWVCSCCCHRTFHHACGGRNSRCARSTRLCSFRLAYRNLALGDSTSCGVVRCGSCAFVSCLMSVGRRNRDEVWCVCACVRVRARARIVPARGRWCRY